VAGASYDVASTSYDVVPIAAAPYDGRPSTDRATVVVRGAHRVEHGGVEGRASSNSAVRRRRRLVAERLAWSQDGVVSRRDLYAIGITRAEIRANIAADRWVRLGRQSVCVHRGPLSQRARHRAAVQEAGPRAYLDAGSALIEAGLTGFEMPRIRVSVPRGARAWRVKGLDVRQTRRWDPHDLVLDDGLRRARPAVAAVRQALWARTDREAALVLTMTVQQGLATADRVAEALLAVRRDRRRAFVSGVVMDLLGGVRSLGELDVVRECRRRGLPEPSKQVLRRGRNGTYYLDLLWEAWGVVVEVDGIQHSWAAQVVGDAIRQNDITLQGARVLRLPLLGLRVAPDDFFAQVEQALVAAGWDARRTA
jgi:very-short-patch-repair endonuclease